MLIRHVLELAHNKLGYNGISQTSVILKQLYYWEGMKSSIIKHVKFCDMCQNATFK